MPEPADPREVTAPATADCCAVDARIAEAFDRRLTEMSVDGELPEMVDVSEMLLRLMPDVGSALPSVLEFGCGSGALTVELLRRGAASADAVDLSPDMIDAARRRAAEAAVSEHVTFSEGDASLIEHAAHDWVVLDRVMCCYPDVERLLGTATRAATRRVAFTVPNSRGWRGVANKLMWQASNIPQRLGRPGCLAYVHSLDRIESRLAEAGFELRARDRLGLWYAAVWDRAATI